MSEIDKILEDRGSRYGDFGAQAQVSRAIKESFESTPNWSYLPPYMREGLDLVAVKISRMLCGDPMYMDNVVDILGYMTLVKTEMEKEHARIKAFSKRAGVEDSMAAQGYYQPSSFYAAQGESCGTHSSDVGAIGSPLNWAGPYRNP